MIGKEESKVGVKAAAEESEGDHPIPVEFDTCLGKDLLRLAECETLLR